MSNKYDKIIDGYEIRFLVSESGDEYIEIEHRGRIADMYADDAKAIADYVLESKVGDKIVKWRYNELPDYPAQITIGEMWIPRKTALAIFKYIDERLREWERTFHLYHGVK